MNTALIFIESHFDHILLTLLVGWFMVLILRGNSQALFGALKEMLSDDTTNRLSTKRFGYFAGIATLSWGHVQLTRSLCAQIKAGTYQPTTVYVASLGILATLVGAGYLFGKLIGKAAKDAGIDPDDGAK